MTTTTEIKIIPKEAIKASYRKEDKFNSSYSLISFDDGKFEEIISLRLYCPNTTFYCCFWLWDTKNNLYASGSGKAGGYDYDKASSAANEAMKNAGIFFKSINGMGDAAIRETLQNIALNLGYKNTYVHKSFG